MASTFTTYLNLEKPATGDQIDAWGGTVNNNWDIVDNAVDGTTAITPDIDGGTIDNTPIGGTTPAAGDFTTITASGDVNFNSGGFFFDQSLGRVGINEASPTAELHISDATDPQIVFEDTGGGLSAINSFDGNLQISADTGNTVASSNIQFLVDTSEVARFDANGRLGIGETSPATPLHVTSVGDTLATFESTDLNAIIDLTDSTATSRILNSAGKLSLRADPNSVGADSRVDFTIDGSEVARFDSNGRLGIGETSPGVPLHITDATAYVRLEDTGAASGGYGQIQGTTSGGITFAADPDNVEATSLFAWRIDNTERMRLDENGYLGIGVTNPAGALDVETGSTTNDMRITFEEDAGNVQSIYFYEAAQPYFSIQHDGSGSSPDNVLKIRSASTTSGIDTDVMTIEQSGNVGIGETDPISELHITDSGGNVIFTMDNGTGRAQFVNTSGGEVLIRADDTNAQAGSTIRFEVDGTEVARFEDGTTGLLVGTTTDLSTLISSSTEAGTAQRTDGATAINRGSARPLYVNRLTNDGVVVSIRQNGSEEGSISVSGTTVSYNNFLGSHYSELQSAPEELLRGTIVETTGQLVSDRFTRSERLPKFKVSDTVASPAVYGAILGPSYSEEDDNNPNPPPGQGIGRSPVRQQYSIAALGAGHIRIKSGEAVSVGDLIESAGDGTGQVQADDIIRSRTVCKITSTVVVDTYPDGSRLFPCVFYCG